MTLALLLGTAAGVTAMCLAAPPATQPTSKRSLAPETRDREGKITVDAINGGDFRLKVVKGDVYTFDASGEWTDGTLKPFGPEGRSPPKGFVSNRQNVDLHALEAWFTTRTVDMRVEIGKKSRWTAPADGHLVLRGLDKTTAKQDKREGKIVVRFRRVVTGKAES